MILISLWFGMKLFYEDYDKAISSAQAIIKRDPLSTEAFWYLGLSYYLARQYEESIEAFESALKINPNYSEAHRGMGATYRELKMFDESIQSIERALQLTLGRGPAVMDLLAVLGASGKEDELKGWLNNLQEVKKQHTVPPIVFAIGYAYLGDMDEAFIWLQKTRDDRFFWLLSIKVAPDWDIFRGDPRFDEFIQEMSFPENKY